jgi:Flp pilus assembly protein TadD
MTAQQQESRIPGLVSDEVVDGFFRAATMAYDMGEYEDAFNLYRGAAIARPKDSRGVTGMGIALYCLGRVEEAEAAYRKAIGVEPRDQEAHLYLGELLWNEKRDVAAAANHLATAFRIQPQNKLGARARYILSTIKAKSEAI